MVEAEANIRKNSKQINKDENRNYDSKKVAALLSVPTFCTNPSFACLLSSDQPLSEHKCEKGNALLEASDQVLIQNVCSEDDNQFLNLNKFRTVWLTLEKVCILLFPDSNNQLQQ